MMTRWVGQSDENGRCRTAWMWAWSLAPFTEIRPTAAVRCRLDTLCPVCVFGYVQWWLAPEYEFMKRIL